MIHPYSDTALQKWNRGEYKVQLDIPNRPRPLGYCEGTPEDEAELVAMSEGEGEHTLEIHKRILKTGREIWTLRTLNNAPEEDVEDD